MTHRAAMCSLLTLLGLAPVVSAQPRLAEYFGFGDLEVVKIDRGAGPIVIADMNGDGLQDLVAVNNYKSRIELHYQRPDASPDAIEETAGEVNELPTHWRFRSDFVSVSHRVMAVVAHDYDGDGLKDLIYAGQPPELVFVRQTSPGTFEIDRIHRIKLLQANRNALLVADVLDDPRPELLTIVGGEIHIWTIDGSNLGQPTKLIAGSDLVGIGVEDFDGDGQADVLGVIPENPAPLRLWLGQHDGARHVLGPQVRFELPALREYDAVRFPGDAAASIATIERASKRLVLYDLAMEPVEPSGNRDASMRVYSFSDGGNRKRKTSVADVNGDGLLDLVATNTESNSLVVYLQAPGKGLQTGVPHPSLAEMTYLDAGNVDGGSEAEIFVLSEKEAVLGRTRLEAGVIDFPQPIAVSEGHTPVAMALVELGGRSSIALVTKADREWTMEIIPVDGTERQVVSLGKLSRSPDTIVDLDADRDGRTDLLLFTRDKPMIMLRATADGYEMMDSEKMGQFGLVQAANADNTGVFDIDQDGVPELLIATQNYVRAVRYDPRPERGIGAGWQVVQQINAGDPSSKLIALTVLGRRIVAADKENNRLVMMGETTTNGATTWQETESINVRGFTPNAIYSGAFSGDGEDNILAIGDDGFAIIKLAGERVALRELTSWRTDKERRVEHEFAVGDINGDGFVDLVALDAGEQMCEIFTFTTTRKMLYAMSFEVFETKIFSGGEAREFEPSEAHIADLTGDGADDLILLTHDRVLIYPQMTKTTDKR
ncbi:MAG: VCBS repeat-containing protein [Phycisphaerales bacterium]|nr:VCBS repeat-containing protein [Phycisphaerales bacterium]